MGFASENRLYRSGSENAAFQGAEHEPVDEGGDEGEADDDDGQVAEEAPALEGFFFLWRFGHFRYSRPFAHFLRRNVLSASGYCSL